MMPDRLVLVRIILAAIWDKVMKMLRKNDVLRNRVTGQLVVIVPNTWL